MTDPLDELGEGRLLPIKAARDLAREYRNAAREGIDRLADERRLRQERRLRGNTLAEMIDRYVADRKVQALRTYAEYGRLLRLEVVPHLGHLRPDEVTKGHVRALVAGIAQGTLQRDHASKSSSPFVANRVLGVLQAMYGAIKNDLGPNRPAMKSPGIVFSPMTRSGSCGPHAGQRRLAATSSGRRSS